MLCELGTELIRQNLGASLTVHKYALNEDRIQELFCHLFREGSFHVTLLISARVLQLVLDNCHAKSHIPYGMSVPTAFEVLLYVHAVDLMSRKVIRIRPKIGQKAVSSTRACMLAKLVQKTCGAVSKPCSLRPLQTMIQPYISVNSVVIKLQVLSQRSDRLVLLKQEEFLFEEGLLL